MKKIDFCTKGSFWVRSTMVMFAVILFMVCIDCTQAQMSTSNNQQNSSDFYLQKNKNQKTAGLILLGTGTAVAIAGLGIFSRESASFWGGIIVNGDFDNGAANRAQIGSILFLSGVVADLISIPFFISAGHNKKIAGNISFNLQNSYYDLRKTCIPNIQPALTLTIGFGDY